MTLFLVPLEMRDLLYPEHEPESGWPAERREDVDVVDRTRARFRSNIALKFGLPDAGH